MTTPPEYLFTLPEVIPDRRRLVHNSVPPTQHIGSRGFRMWLAAPDVPRLTPCDCGWAPELGAHYRVLPVGSRAAAEVLT